MDFKAAKRRKLIDKSLPTAILQNPDFAVEDSKMYQSLLDMERKLDWVMTRKKVGLQDPLGRGVSAWQPQEENSTGETNVPAWQLKIEGRVLELLNQRSKDKGPPRKFSTLIKRLVVELDRDPKLYPESNIVEWPRATGSHNPVMDGSTVRRTGHDTPTNIRIVLYLDHYPEQYKVSPELALDVSKTSENLPTRIHGLAECDTPEDRRMALVWGRTRLPEPLRGPVPRERAVYPREVLLVSEKLPEAGDQRYWAGWADSVFSQMQMEGAEARISKEVEFSRMRRCLIAGSAIAEQFEEALIWRRARGIWILRRVKEPGSVEETRKRKREVDGDGDGDGDCCKPRSKASRSPTPTSTSPSSLSRTCLPLSSSPSLSSASASPPSITPQSPSLSQDENPGDEDKTRDLLAEALLTLANLTKEKRREELYARTEKESRGSLQLDAEEEEERMEN
ncbi:SWI/SNF and RSC complex subunit Ssr3 [Marasmius crinis-equi]|uniref:SWI/SNF and RSC complex subunit Ssr3 n=1 Tax=Marasmius crinis-equi TaxID=585013 RepID=A0ABR3ETC8_9AGAR